MASLSGVSSNLQALSLEVSRKFSMTSVPSSLCSAERVHIPGVAISKTLRPALACLSKSPCHINKFSRAIFPQRLNKLSKFRCDAAISSPNNVIREGGLDTLDFPGESDTEDFSPPGYEFETEAAQDDEILEISKLGLDSSIVDSLSQRGISSLFPIQRAVFVPAMEGRDIIGRAKTGTGKTLAFGIPIIQRIIEENTSQGRRQSRKLPRVLVLAPTRELAKQVEKEFKESAPYLSTVCIYGGVSYTSQQSALARGVDIVVGTPGRIIDLVEGRSLVLSEVKFLVLDEADQMLAVGFEEPVEVILEKLPEQRQSMLFSATMPGWVKKLARKHLNDPLTIDLVGESDEKLAEGIKLYAVSSAQSTASKRSILGDLITVYAKGGKSIVFTRTKRDADDVSMALSKEITCEALHGDISQYQRERTLAKFREGKFSTLVATDVAARGLDIPNVDLVVHYELPTDSETFVHRSGRTGRAGKEGVAILMHTIREKRKLKILEKEVNCRFEYVQPPQPKEVLDSSTHHVAKSLEGVHPELIEMFLPAAEKLLEGDPRNAMAAALACLSGFSQPPSSRSLLTLEKGWMTLQIVKDSSELMGGRKLTPRDVRGVLSSIWPTAADQVGKICIIDDRKVEGAVFDLPEDVAKDFLKKDILPGYEVYAASKLPELEEEDSLFPSRGGSFSSRGGSYSSRGGSFSSRGGSFSSRGGSFRGSRGRGAGRSSNGWNRSFEDDSHGDGDNDWFGGRKSRQSEDNDWFGGRRSRQSDDNDWFGGRKSREGGSDFSGGRRSSRSPFGSSSDGNFRGTCYKCGQSGHRASDCPSS